MKRTLALLWICSLTTMLMAQKRETRNVETFDQISFRVPGKLMLRQGSPQKVGLEGPDDILREIETSVDGGKLVIKKEGRDWGWNWGSNDRITVYITVKDISALSVGGSGDLIGETKIVSNDLRLSVSGSGGMDLEVEVRNELEADVSGSGRIDVKGSCAQLDSDVSGSGRVMLDAAVKEKASFGISGSGRIDAAGSAREMKAVISGSGRVSAADLEVSKCEVRISGSGDVSIHVKDELNANISGSGSVSYKGNPNHVNSNSSGSGKVRKM